MNSFQSISEMMLDNYALLLCSKGDTDKNIFGSIEEYASEKVQKRIKAEIVDPDKFLDIMVELSYAAWHVSNGHKVVPTDRDGTADFQVLISGEQLPIYCDCKRIKKETNDNRFQDVVRKANSQIKKSGEKSNYYGIAVIDVTEKVEQTPELSDDLPVEIVAFSNLIQQRIMTFNSAISAVILLWNEFTTIGKPGESPITSVVLRRRNHIVKHEKPIYTLPESHLITKIGNTVEFMIHWRRRPIYNDTSSTDTRTDTRT